MDSAIERLSKVYQLDRVLVWFLMKTSLLDKELVNTDPPD
jgi:hypothetical protein